MEGKPEFIHLFDKFLSKFNQLYWYSEEYREGIICSLLNGFGARMSEDSDPKCSIGTLTHVLI